MKFTTFVVNFLKHTIKARIFGMSRTIIVDALKRTDFGASITVKGWVRTRRGNKNVSFIALNDGSTIHSIQIVADGGRFNPSPPEPAFAPQVSW